MNRFNMYVFIQVLLIAGVGLLFSFAIQKDFMRMTSAGLLIIWVGQILFLAWYMNRIHRDMGRFMNALRNQDTSQQGHRKKFLVICHMASYAYPGGRDVLCPGLSLSLPCTRL